MRRCVLGLLGSLVVACGTFPGPYAAPGLPTGRVTALKASKPQAPIYNLARGNDTLYRGGEPEEAGLKAIAKLGIRSVVCFQSHPDVMLVVAKEQAAAARLC